MTSYHSYELSPPKNDCKGPLPESNDTGSPSYLILGGSFSGSTKIHFETVQVGKSRTRILYIRNPTEAACAIRIVKMPKEFVLSCSEEEVIEPLSQLEVRIVWSPKAEVSMFESVPILSTLNGFRLSFQLLGKSEPAPKPGKLNKRRPLIIPNSKLAPRAKDPTLKIHAKGTVCGITVPISPNFTHRKKEGEIEKDAEESNEIVQEPPRDDVLGNFEFPFTPEPISKTTKPVRNEIIRRETFCVEDDLNFLPPNGLGSPLRRETFNVVDSPLGNVSGEVRRILGDETERASESLECSGDQQSLNETVREIRKDSKEEESAEDGGLEDLSMSTLSQSDSSKTEEFINISSFDLKPRALVALENSIKSQLGERIHELVVSGFEKDVIIETLEKDGKKKEIEEELKVYFRELCSAHTSIGRKFELVKATFDSESFILVRLQLREIIGALEKEITVGSEELLFLAVSYLIEAFDLEWLWAAASLLFNDPDIPVEREAVRERMRRNLEGDLFEGELSGTRNMGEKFIEKFFSLVILLDRTGNPLIFNPTYNSTRRVLDAFCDLYHTHGRLDGIPLELGECNPRSRVELFEALRGPKMSYVKLLVLTEELIKGEEKNKFLCPSSLVDLLEKEQSEEALEQALKSLNKILHLAIPLTEAEWMFYGVSHFLTEELLWRILVRVRFASVSVQPMMPLNETF